MKNISLILNIVLLVAVGVLYYLHFSGGKPGPLSKDGGRTSVELGDLKIAYINSDSVLKHYAYLDVKRKQLEDKTRKLDQEYRNRAQGLQNDITSYQRNVNNMTLSQARAIEEDLAKKQQNLRLYEQSLTQDMMNEEAKLNQELYERVTAFLKKFGEENNLQFVLKFDATSDLLFAGEALDITKEVIAGLNASYESEQTPASKARKDSTAIK